MTKPVANPTPRAARGQGRKRSNGVSRLTLKVGSTVDIFQRTPTGLLHNLMQATVLEYQPGTLLRLRMANGDIWEAAQLPPLRD